MKKIKYLFLLLIALMVIPFGVFADEGNENAQGEVSKEVPIYFFRGQGCSHCAEAEEWFKEIEGEYGSKFVIKDYETWYNQDNSELMQRVAEARNEKADGVPYIIIGNRSWNGFAEDYKSEILEQINKVYDEEVSARYDILQLVDTNAEKEEEKSTGSDVLDLIIILAVVGVVGVCIYKARQTVSK